MEKANLICIDFAAPQQIQLREIKEEEITAFAFETVIYQELLTMVEQKLVTLKDQNEYLEVLIEVKNRLEQDAQKFELQSKISQLKSCMKKSRDILVFLEKHKNDIPLILKKIQDNFTIIQNKGICLNEESEIQRRMNMKYQKLIEKQLESHKKVKSILSQANEQIEFEDIDSKSGDLELNFANPSFIDQLEKQAFDLDPFIYCQEGQMSSQSCRALGARLAKNAGITSLSLNLIGSGIKGQRLESITMGLSQNKSIKNLNLNLKGNMINQSDVQLLNALIVQNYTLESLDLDLSYNNVKGGGVKDLGFGISKNKGLKKIKLDICENNISKSGQKQFDQFIKNKNVSVKSNKGIESPSYSIFTNYHQSRLAKVQEIIVKQSFACNGFELMQS